MIALTYMSKSQYREIRKNAQFFEISDLSEKYGVCMPMKVQQYAIVNLIETAWSSYKNYHGHAPKDSDIFYEFIVEQVWNVNGVPDTTIWEQALVQMNKSIRRYNKTAENKLLEVGDNELSRATLYTHIKAKIGDW